MFACQHQAGEEVPRKSALRIDEPGEYGRWSQAGRRLIERRYNWPSHCADLAGLLGRESQARRAAAGVRTPGMIRHARVAGSRS